MSEQVKPASEQKPTYYCLGNGERGCDGCGQEKNWQELNKLPDEFRKLLQAEFVRVDDTECILRGRPWFVCSETGFKHRHDHKDRRDAERYRLLRDDWWFRGGHENIRQALTPDELDEAIGAAIASVKGGAA